MKRHEAKSVTDIIEDALARTGNRDEFERQQACFLWPEVVGPTINRYTVRRWIDRDVMHVHISSASVKNDLYFRRIQLVEAINKMLGKNVVNKIIFH